MKTKRLLPLFLALLILVFLFSAAAFAEELTENDPSGEEQGNDSADPDDGPTVEVPDWCATGDYPFDLFDFGFGHPPYNERATVEKDETLSLQRYDFVEENYGTIEENLGMIYYSAPETSVTENKGYIGYNHGTVEENRGRIGKNGEDGVVKENKGIIDINSEATVERNDGIIGTNQAAKIIDNYGIVENNESKIENNYGYAYLNMGEVDTNEEGGVLMIENLSIVYNNLGTVYRIHYPEAPTLVAGGPGTVYTRINIERDEHINVTAAVSYEGEDAITLYAGEAWQADGSGVNTAAITFSAEDGYCIDGVYNCYSQNGIHSTGTIWDNKDGTWTVFIPAEESLATGESTIPSFKLDASVSGYSVFRPHGSGDDGVCITLTDAEMMEFWFNYGCREKILNAEENAVVDLDLTAGWDRLQLMTLDALRQRPDVRAWLLLPHGEILALPAGFAARVPECNTTSLATLRSLLAA